MKLIFLDRGTLTYKDNAYVSNEFEIIIDSVVKQKSNFVANKETINASVGDIVVLKEGELSYIGILQSITQNKDKTSKIQLNDFKEIFNIEVPISSFSGDICLLLANTIKKAFIENSDDKQNLKYLRIKQLSSVEGNLNYNDDTLIKIEDLIEMVSKTYGIILHYKVKFLRGRFVNIEIIIQEESHLVKLRHDFKAISNLTIKESEDNTVNKCIFYPKADNETHKDERCFYLLKDGTISEDKESENRFNYVNVYSAFYADNEYENLITKAQEKMINSSQDHQITFELDGTNKIFIPLANIFVGYFIEFYAPKRTYMTMLTQIKYKNTFSSCTLTLGEQRNSLTDKIKMLSKGGQDSGTTINVSTNLVNLDGGQY